MGEDEPKPNHEEPDDNQEDEPPENPDDENQPEEPDKKKENEDFTDKAMSIIGNFFM